jgi:hypothetical protein
MMYGIETSSADEFFWLRRPQNHAIIYVGVGFSDFQQNYNHTKFFP